MESKKRSGIAGCALRLAVGAAALVGVLLITGAIYEMAATAQDARRYPPPGQMVDVGGYRLHIQCSGEGSPTVILDSLGDGMSSDWAWVQPEIAAKTRVCAYDRAGLGWSDLGPSPRDAQQGAEELHTLLTNAGIEGPYILVGHSYAAHIARLFADQFPEEVVGMVLVDPGIFYHDPALPESFYASQDSEAGQIQMASVLATFGALRLTGNGLALAKGLPSQQAAEFNADYSSGQHWIAVKAQSDALPATTEEVMQAGGLGDIPLIILSATLPDDEVRQAWTARNAAFGSLSSNAVHRVVEGATHAGLETDQDFASTTAAAIMDVLSASETGASLAP